MTPVEQRASAILTRIPKNRPSHAVEVGVLIGALSEILLRERPQLTLSMVDSWAPAERQPERYKATGDVHAHHDVARVRLHRKEAEARVARFGERARVVALDSLAAAERFAKRSLDLVFIDADHSYEGVMLDLLAWEERVVPGGWICGHDYANPDPAFRFGVTRAVDEWADAWGHVVELDRNYTWFVRL